MEPKKYEFAEDLLALFENEMNDDGFDDNEDFDEGMFPNCFFCMRTIEHEGLLIGLFVIAEQNNGSHRFGIVITCPECDKHIAVFDPLRRKEFAYEPTH